MKLHTVKFTQADEGLIIPMIKLREGDYITKDQILYYVEYNDVEVAIKSPVNGTIKKVYAIGGRQVIRKDNLIVDIEIDENVKIEEQKFEGENYKEIIFTQFDSAVIKEMKIKLGDILDDYKEYLLCAQNEEYEFKMVNPSLAGKVVEICVKEGQTIRKGDVIAKVAPLSENDVALLELNQEFDKLKQLVGELEAAPKEMHKAYYALMNNGAEPPSFGEDEKLSNKEFARKYGDKTYQTEDMTPALMRELILHKCNFSIKTDDIASVVDEVEEMIEKCGYKCRVYMENRASAMAAAAVPGVGMIASIAAGVAIAAHNLATFDPDFEIGKNFWDGKVNVVYKK
ncbi:biotin/lipoyl-containing protein [Pasteurellaceae bacterium 22721_9_1]